MSHEVSYKPECWCEDADDRMVCDDCGVIWDLKTKQWLFQKGVSYYYKCRHTHFPVYFSDDLVVYASSHTDREDDDQKPDWGLYLDSVWRPTSMAGFIEWEDFGLPIDWKAAAHMIIDAYRRAMADFWVEVSCIGGHGRTGTALACMAVLDGHSPESAIQYVRGSYCKKAIETDEQEWFVTWFNAYVNGGQSDPWPGKKSKNNPDGGRTWVFQKGFDWKRKSLLGEPGRAPVLDGPSTINYRYTKKPEKSEPVVESVTDAYETSDGDEAGFVEYCLHEITMIMSANDLTGDERELLDRWCSKYVDNRKMETT